MDSSIPYGEAWLLETLVMYRIPVWGLTRGERAIREWLNRGYHDLSRSEFEWTIKHLFASGQVEAYRDGADVGFNPTPSELDAALSRKDKQMYCGVTASGGERWESLAAPDWSRFFWDSCWEENTVEITAGSDERVIEVVANAELLWGCYMEATRLDVARVEPWQALPWKSLAVGFRTVVSYTRPTCIGTPTYAIPEGPAARWSRHVQLRTWATSICGRPYV